MQHTLALVDCNNFYASCERVFQPSLTQRPVVILSNNDGCVIARSNESKALGIPMGAPFHQLREVLERHQVVVMSSNYALYGDMSRRVMQVLSEWSPRQEVYSIDESFLDLTGMMNPTGIGIALRGDVRRRTGIPVGVGIASTKTLAKLANHCAKKREPWKANGVCNLNELSRSELAATLSDIDVGDIWGIGRRLGANLVAQGIRTALDLQQADRKRLRDQHSVVMEKLIRELNGEACLDVEEVASPKKQIVASRSFGMVLDDLEELRSSVAAHVSRATAKLRAQGSTAGALIVFIRTNPFRERDPQLSRSVVVPLVTATDDLLKLHTAAQQGLQQIYRPGYLYHKAGIMLEQLQPKSVVQTDLFAEQQTPQKAALLDALDQVNRRFGKGVVHSAAELLGRGRWHMRRERKSPEYTSHWDQLLQV